MNGDFDKIELLTYFVFPPLFSFLLEFLSSTTKYNHCILAFDSSFAWVDDFHFKRTQFVCVCVFVAAKYFYHRYWNV